MNAPSRPANATAAMPFIDICRAIYDWAPQSDEELEVKDGDLLFVLDKSGEDDWWKCKRKAASDDEEEPDGLVPSNYVEKVKPLKQARALYDYTKQTDEELSFKEDARLDVYDESDPDWTLVGVGGDYGFAPAIYIESAGAETTLSSAPVATPSHAITSPPPQQRVLAPPPMPSRPTAADDFIPGEADYPEPPAPNPAAALAGIIAHRTGGAPTMDRGLASPPLPQRPQYTPDESEGEELPPPKPARPQSQTLPPPSPQYASSRFAEPPGVMPSPPGNRAMSGNWDDQNEEESLRSPGGFHLYNIHEMVSHMGKNKKMPTTLGINIAKGLITISPEKSRDGPSYEWTADKLIHYSIEGKHVFVDLVRPSKSVDLHAGAKDTAQEIVAQLGELAGASRLEGLKEVWAASEGTGAGGKKKGKMLYEFIAQGDDEVTVAVDDEVIVLDDTRSEEWWMVRRLKNGKEGVVPSNYVEITGTVQTAPDTITGLNAAKSTVEQNRLEEERLARDAAKKEKAKDGSIPERYSSLSGDSRRHSQHSQQKRSSKESSKAKPNQHRVRTWTDRSGTFKVEAEFIGLRDGKIHLHKQNGVKIAVPVAKMAVEDLEYVESVTGASLDEDKPLSDIKRRSTHQKKTQGANGTVGASVQPKEQYDWFDFFLQAGVNPQICERYASAFSRDQMTLDVLPEVNEQLLRTLGFKEGDILRVTKYLDNKYDRKRTAMGSLPSSSGGQDEDKIEPVNGGLFSGPGGALKNNTRKGRPAPTVQTNDVVSEDAFKPRTASPAVKDLSGDATATPLTSAPARQATGGFDDNAWEVKPTKVQTPSSAPAEPLKPAEASKPKINDDLSLLALPLQPDKTPQPLSSQSTASPASAASPAPTQSPPPTQQPQNPTGADQALFEKIAALAPPRQRPQPPAQQSTTTGLAPPPRASSAPGFNPQLAAGHFGPPPLQPQLTGYQPQPQMYPQQTGFMQQQPQVNGIQLQQGYGSIQQQQPQPIGVPAMQQNFPALQPQPTGMAFQPQSNFGQQQAMQQYPQQTGFQTGFQQQPPPSYQQQLVNGAQSGSPFADPPRQPYQPAAPSGLSNSFTASQPTGFQLQPQQQPTFNISQPTGFGIGMNTGFQTQIQQAPQLPPQQTGGVFGPEQPIIPLVPQKTGPAPPVRFGVTGGANKLMAQPTGRANLAKASKCFVKIIAIDVEMLTVYCVPAPQNPFGF